MRFVYIIITKNQSKAPAWRPHSYWWCHNTGSAGGRRRLYCEIGSQRVGKVQAHSHKTTWLYKSPQAHISYLNLFWVQSHQWQTHLLPSPPPTAPTIPQHLHPSSSPLWDTLKPRPNCSRCFLSTENSVRDLRLEPHPCPLYSGTSSG